MVRLRLYVVVLVSQVGLFAALGLNHTPTRLIVTFAVAIITASVFRRQALREMTKLAHECAIQFRVAAVVQTPRNITRFLIAESVLLAIIVLPTRELRLLSAVLVLAPLSLWQVWQFCDDMFTVVALAAVPHRRRGDYQECESAEPAQPLSAE